MNTRKQRTHIRIVLACFITLLVLSGLTAFPLEWEIRVMQNWRNYLPDVLHAWYDRISEGIVVTNARYPFMAYGTDWLAFSHIIIALFFLAPFKDPVKYSLLIDIGILACGLVLPLAFICGPVRGIPFFWSLIDSSFGIIGAAVLYYIRIQIKKMEKQTNKLLLT
jgi:hypothetical protein